MEKILFIYLYIIILVGFSISNFHFHSSPFYGGIYTLNVLNHLNKWVDLLTMSVISNEQR